MGSAIVVLSNLALIQVATLDFQIRPDKQQHQQRCIPYNSDVFVLASVDFIGVNGFNGRLRLKDTGNAIRIQSHFSNATSVPEMHS